MYDFKTYVIQNSAMLRENAAGSGRKHRWCVFTTEYLLLWYLLIASNVIYEKNKTADTKLLLFIEPFIPVKSTTIKMLS